MRGRSRRFDAARLASEIARERLEAEHRLYARRVEDQIAGLKKEVAQLMLGAHEAHIEEWIKAEAAERFLELCRWESDGGALDVGRPSFFKAVWRPLDQPREDTRYNSVQEFMDVINRAPCKNKRNEFARKLWAHGEPPGRPTGYLGHCKTGDDVQKLVRDGWPEGLERARKLIESFNTDDLVPMDRRRRLQRGDFGDHLDIGAVYSGHHMSAWTRAKRKHAIAPQEITILANITTPFWSNADVLFWKGAAAVVLSDLLEMAGYNTRVVMGCGGRGQYNHKGYSWRITIKEFGTPLDLSTATAALLPGFERAMTHAWNLIMDEEEPNNKSMFLTVGTVKTDPGEYRVPHGVDSEQTARRWIADTLEKINAQEG